MKLRKIKKHFYRWGRDGLNTDTRELLYALYKTKDWRFKREVRVILSMKGGDTLGLRSIERRLVNKFEREFEFID